MNSRAPFASKSAMRSLCTLLAFAATTLADEADEAFARELFSRLAAREGNVVCSPLSVRIALAMAFGGARGTTAEEMGRVLRCDESVHAAFARLVREYDGRDGRPALADAAWVKPGVTLLPPYLDLVRNHYGAVPTPLDFTATDAACARINGWVAERTHDRIREIVVPDMLDANTTLVLVNALHFKAAWEDPFRERMTRPAPFTLVSGEKVEVPIMVRGEHFRYAEKDGAAAVELPYAGRRFSMVIVLPAAGAPATLPEGLLGSLKGKSVAVHLPRFKVESAFELAEVLQAMGMKSAFGGDADFSGMNGKKDLFISAVAHKAFVAVDEEGTEAAAATSVRIQVKGAADKPVVFRADRPFLFLIRDGETGSILFLGRVADPR